MVNQSGYKTEVCCGTSAQCTTISTVLATAYSTATANRWFLNQYQVTSTQVPGGAGNSASSNVMSVLVK